MGGNLKIKFHRLSLFTPFPRPSPPFPPFPADATAANSKYSRCRWMEAGKLSSHRFHGHPRHFRRFRQIGRRRTYRFTLIFTVSTAILALRSVPSRTTAANVIFPLLPCHWPTNWINPSDFLLTTRFIFFVLRCHFFHSQMPMGSNQRSPILGTVDAAPAEIIKERKTIRAI